MTRSPIRRIRDYACLGKSASPPGAALLVSGLPSRCRGRKKAFAISVGTTALPMTAAMR